MSLDLEFSTVELQRLSARLIGLAKLNDRDHADLLEGVGGLVEGQAKNRIRNEKTAPDGTPWQAWSDNYRATRHGGNSLLMGEGHLDDSIQYIVDGDEVAVGSNLIYAAIHQLGGTPDMAPGPAAISARAYLGLSVENEHDIDGLIEDFLRDQIQELSR
ncbi:phage virion morphogenesis protein [Oceanobacter sp. 4_MG-2023]|uniref:phage virion morphogenesis protein n=1 Tax=Oceanobacter sp. 4_MG-2023 TaxID=3062623 RepID=UPI002733DCF2|nr:phage virion morphogenesis protein [Oceanobacter sp. 4_MG-2023]MDP2548485.1 phage virion morphogenesis protein [Oceanobacter sp. 4_MG-2023]